jgi:hypothetical protein
MEFHVVHVVLDAQLPIGCFICVFLLKSFTERFS